MDFRIRIMENNRENGEGLGGKRRPHQRTCRRSSTEPGSSNGRRESRSRSPATRPVATLRPEPARDADAPNSRGGNLPPDIVARRPDRRLSKRALI